MSDLIRQKSFQERIADRIREDIGKLLADEELRVIVERAVEEAFFKPVLLDESAWGQKRYAQPFLHQLLKELLENQVKNAVDGYLATHAEDVNKAITSTIEGGMWAILVSAITSRFQWELQQFQNNIVTNLSQRS